MVLSSLSERDSRGAGESLDGMNSPGRQLERLSGEELREYGVDWREVGRGNRRSHRIGSNRGDGYRIRSAMTTSSHGAGYAP